LTGSEGLRAQGSGRRAKSGERRAESGEYRVKEDILQRSPPWRGKGWVNSHKE